MPDEEPLNAAVREFEEETGYKPSGEFIELGSILQKGCKEVVCWAVNGNFNTETIVCNTFEIEWPPRTGQKKSFPEIDRAGWFNYTVAKSLINEQQFYFIEKLSSFLLK